MNRYKAITALIALPLALIAFKASADDSPSVTETEKQMLGRWKIVQGVNLGTPLTPKEMDELFVIVKKGMVVTLDDDENEKYRAKFVIDETKQPAHIDMTTYGGRYPKVKSKGIVSVSDSGWKVCYALPGAPRPTEFASDQESQTMLFVHEPIKQKSTK